MPKRFSFDLFRLNIEDSSDLFIDTNPKRLRGDTDIRQLLEASCDAVHDQIQKTRSAVFKWSIRSFVDLTEIAEQRDLVHIVLARSNLEKDGMSVTDEGLTNSTSVSYPPLASTNKRGQSKLVSDSYGRPCERPASVAILGYQVSFYVSRRHF